MNLEIYFFKLKILNSNRNSINRGYSDEYLQSYNRHDREHMEYLNNFTFFNFLANITRRERQIFIFNLSRDSAKIISSGFYNLLVNENIQSGAQKKAISKYIVIVRSIADPSLSVRQRIIKIKSNPNLVKIVSQVLARYLKNQILNDVQKSKI